MTEYLESSRLLGLQGIYHGDGGEGVSGGPAATYADGWGDLQVRVCIPLSLFLG